MTDAEIIKALECCCEAELKEDCKKLKCPFFDNEIYNCMNVDDENAMCRYSLDLISRQKAEIEKLQKENNQFADIVKLYSEIKAEARKEFAERLTDNFCPMCDYEKWQIEDAVDNLIKEMEGEK